MASEDGGAGPENAGLDGAELKARLAALSHKLAEADRAGAQASAGTPDAGSTSRALSQGMRAMGEFVGAVAVSAAIGWQLDEWTGAAPAFLVVFLALGTAAGFWGIYRMSAGLSPRPHRAGRMKRPDPAKAGDE